LPLSIAPHLKEFPSNRTLVAIETVERSDDTKSRGLGFCQISY